MSLTTLNEQYYFLEGADESLILLNPVLKNQNLQFVKFTFAEFEEKFWRFFLHDAKHRKHGTETYKKGEIVVYENISSVFFKTITKNNLLSVTSLFLKGYIIFLKNNNADGIYQLDMDELLNSLYNDEGEDKNKGDGNILQLIYKLRLFKKVI